MKQAVAALIHLPVSVVLVVAGVHGLRQVYPKTRPIGSGFDLADFFMLVCGAIVVAGVAGLVGAAATLIKGRK